MRHFCPLIAISLLPNLILFTWSNVAHAGAADPGNTAKMLQFIQIIQEIATHGDLNDADFVAARLRVKLIPYVGTQPASDSYEQVFEAVAPPDFLNIHTFIRYTIYDRRYSTRLLAEINFAYLDRSFCLRMKDLDEKFVPTYPKESKHTDALFSYTFWMSGRSFTKVISAATTEDECLGSLQITSTKW